MKKLIYTFLLIFAFSTINTFSQINFQMYFPQEAIEEARDYAEEQTDIQNAELIGIGTRDMSIVLYGINLDVKYDHKTGKASAWGFMFKDANDTNLTATIAAVKFPITNAFYFQTIATDQFDLPIIPVESLDGINWFSSDEVSKILMADDFYKNYINNNIEVKGLALFINTIFDELVMEDPYWVMNLGEKETEDIEVIIYINALNKDYEIIDLRTSVPASAYSNIEIYPNPASDFINVSFDQASEEIKQVILIDNSGVTSDVTTTINRLNDGFSLPLNALSSGSYYLYVKTSNEVKLQKFIIK